MRQKGENILVLLENGAAHPSDVPLTNIELSFLPLNTTSKIQPLDQGIIGCCKKHYRKQIVTLILCNMDSLENSSATSFSKTRTRRTLKMTFSQRFLNMMS